MVPEALIVTDVFLLWSEGWLFGAPFTMLPLLAMAGGGGPTAGTAGSIEVRPFTGEMELALACCACPVPPTATGGFGVLDAIKGGEGLVLVALA